MISIDPPSYRDSYGSMCPKAVIRDDEDGKESGSRRITGLGPSYTHHSQLGCYALLTSSQVMKQEPPLAGADLFAIYGTSGGK